jgi:hypothetical protein
VPLVARRVIHKFEGIGMNKLIEIAKANGAVFEGVCQSCGGSGVVMEEITVPVCCGRFHPHGDCCGNPDPKQDYQPQPCQCGGQVWVHITEAGLRATVEQVCAPLVEALKNAPIVSMFDDAEKFVTEYEKWRDAVKIPVVIKHERALIGDKHE